MAAGDLPACLHPALDMLRGRPSRAWSLIVTFYGDSIVPRGGSVWLGTLTALFGEVGYNAGVVRTAMSRLASEGWLERTARGRNSHYRLTETGRRVFGAASGQIYDPHPPAWGGALTLLIEGEGAVDRIAQRAALAESGFGTPSPGLWLAPARTPGQVPPDGLFRLDARLVAGDAQRLAAQAWPLARMAASYDHFVEAFTPLRRALDGGATLDPAAAAVARLLLIHEYRRIILRDPVLPAELLPGDWPGERARGLCRGIYPRLLPASEVWLDQHGENQDGALPPPDPGLFRRFGQN